MKKCKVDFCKRLAAKKTAGYCASHFQGSLWKLEGKSRERCIKQIQKTCNDASWRPYGEDDGAPSQS